MNNNKNLGEEVSLHSLWWEALCLGEKDAFLNIYKGLYRTLTVFGLRIYQDTDIVTDTLNEVFLEIWEKHDALPRVEQVERYLGTILKRKLLKKIVLEHRLNKAIASVLRENQDQVEICYEELIVRIQSDELVKASLVMALKKLTNQQHKLIQLRFFDGLSYEQVAANSNLTVRTAYNTIHSALKILRIHVKF